MPEIYPSIVRSIQENVYDTIQGKTIPISAGSTALDIRAKVGTSTSPTSTGTKAVTGVGFQPKVVLPFSVTVDAVGAAAESTFDFGCGLSTSSRAAIAVASRNAQTTSATHRRHTAGGLLTTCYGGSVDFAADLNALGSDGFTLDWSAVASPARILNHICLGGADLEVSLVQCQMNGTNAAQSFAHGLSGAPTGLLFFSNGETNAPPLTSTFLGLYMGAWAGSSQFSANAFSSTGVTTTSTRRSLYTSAVLTDMNTSTGRSMAVSSVDATNVNVTYPITSNTFQRYFFMLAIRGAKCQVGTFQFTDTNPLTITTTGITPKLFLPVMIEKGVADVGIVKNDLGMTIGASDGTNNVSCGITDQNAVTTTNARRFQSSNSIVQYGYDGIKYFEATAAFSGQSVVITPTTRLYDFGQGGYLVIGK